MELSGWLFVLFVIVLMAAFADPLENFLASLPGLL
jgi:hypothetical protein